MSYVIAAFPGTGKSWLSNYCDINKIKCSDSDSSLFSWAVIQGARVRHPEWPSNYIKHIKSLITDGTDFIMVSSHHEVRTALAEAGIVFGLVFPGHGCRDEYLQRYNDRGSPQSFLDLMASEFDRFVTDCTGFSSPFCVHYCLESGQYLSDVMHPLCAALNSTHATSGVSLAHTMDLETSTASRVFIQNYARMYPSDVHSLAFEVTAQGFRITGLNGVHVLIQPNGYVVGADPERIDEVCALLEARPQELASMVLAGAR